MLLPAMSLTYSLLKSETSSYYRASKITLVLYLGFLPDVNQKYSKIFKKSNLFTVSFSAISYMT